MPKHMSSRLCAILGSPVVYAQRITRGYANNDRWTIELGDGRKVFVKCATDDRSSEWLRYEHRVYQQVDSQWLPKMLVFQDSERSMLILEDLSACTWPPPWSQSDISAVRQTLAAVSRYPHPVGLRRVVESNCVEGGWPEIARDPEPFLALQLCSRDWLESSLPRLLDAAEWLLLDGESLCHLDVRSDNICLRDGKAVLVDWNLAAVGNAQTDLAFWLPSLSAEGGPRPTSVADIPPGLVAIVAGFFASRAGLPEIRVAPNVRRVQCLQLATALPWAVEVLGLPELDAGAVRRETS